MRDKEQIFVSAFPADPDHQVLALQMSQLAEKEEKDMAMLMTARAGTFNPEAVESGDWNLQDSAIIQEINASRMRHFMRKVGKQYPIYDGGQAERTIIRHNLHIKEWKAFGTWDNVNGKMHSVEELASSMEKAPFIFVTGSPFTPLKATFELFPEAAKNMRAIYSMHATWGKVEMMDLNQNGARRGALQFNVACHPKATKFVVDNIQDGKWNTQLYLGTTECTRVKEIGFKSFEDLKNFLPKTQKTEEILELYKVWYSEAVAPRQAKNPDELIFIHNVIAGFLAQPEKREALYEIVPVKAEVPLDSENLGKMYLTETSEDSNIFATVKLKDGAEKLYLEYLYNIFE